MFLHIRTARRGRLDEGFLFFASKATEAIEAFAFAVTVVKTTVGATGKLGEVTKVIVVVDLVDYDKCVRRLDATARRHGVGTSTSGGEIDFEEVLNASLAGCVREFDFEVKLVCLDDVCVLSFAEVGGTTGVLEVAIGGLRMSRDVLDAVVEAFANETIICSGGLYFDTIEDAVRKFTETALNPGGDEDVVFFGSWSWYIDGLGGPLSAVGVEVVEEELITCQ